MVQAWCCAQALAGFDRIVLQITKRVARKRHVRCPEYRRERAVKGSHKAVQRFVLIPVMRGFNDEESGIASVLNRRNTEGLRLAG